MQLFSSLRLVVWLKRSCAQLERLADFSERIADSVEEFNAIQRQLHPLPRRPVRPVEFGVASVQDFNEAREREHDLAMGGGFGSMGHLGGDSPDAI